MLEACDGQEAGVPCSVRLRSFSRAEPWRNSLCLVELRSCRDGRNFPDKHHFRLGLNYRLAASPKTCQRPSKAVRPTTLVTSKQAAMSIPEIPKTELIRQTCKNFLSILQPSNPKTLNAQIETGLKPHAPAKQSQPQHPGPLKGIGHGHRQDVPMLHLEDKA